MTHSVPATTDPMITPVFTLDSGFAVALWVADDVVDDGVTEETLTLEDAGGRHPSIE